MVQYFFQLLANPLMCIHCSVSSPVVNVRGYGCVVYGELFKRCLHSVEGGGLPHELDATKAVG